MVENMDNATFPVFDYLIILYRIAGYLIAGITIFGNSLTVVAVAKIVQLQTKTNAFITSLALTDICTAFVYLVSSVGGVLSGT